MNATATPRKRMTGQERREQLLDVGRSVFAERGFDAASMEEIASRAGVSKPVVYEHFGGKEGIYAVIVDREMRTLLSRVTDQLGHGGAQARTRAAADAFLQYVEEGPDGFRVLLRDSPMVTVGAGSFGTLIGELADRVDQLMQNELARRGFEREMAPLYSRAVIGLIANVGQWWMELDEGRPTRDVVVAHIVNLVWNGIEGMSPMPVSVPVSGAAAAPSVS